MWVVGENDAVHSDSNTQAKRFDFFTSDVHSDEDEKDIISELKVLQHVGAHPNIVSLLGVSIHEGTPNAGIGYIMLWAKLLILDSWPSLHFFTRNKSNNMFNFQCCS